MTINANQITVEVDKYRKLVIKVVSNENPKDSILLQLTAEDFLQRAIRTTSGLALNCPLEQRYKSHNSIKLWLRKLDENDERMPSITLESLLIFMERDPEIRTTIYEGFRRLIRDPDTDNWTLDPAFSDPVKSLTVGAYYMERHWVMDSDENIEMNRLRN